MRLLRRHLLRSLLGPFIFAWTALTGMLMLNQLAKRFGDLVGKGLPPGIIAEVLILFIPFIVALTLPMAILVAVLYGFTQMGADNELTAMRANGLSVMQMLRPVLGAGALLAVANFVFVDQVLPKTNLRLLNLQVDIAQKKPTFRLLEQVVNDLSPSLYFLQASRIEPGTGRMREVAIYDMSVIEGRRIIYADSGYMAFEEGGRKDLGIRLYEGTVHEYKAGEPGTVNLTRFATNTIRVKDIQNALQTGFGSVQKGDREMTTCEMMDRVDQARRSRARAARGQRSYTVMDVRAILRLRATPDPPGPQPAPLEPNCGVWRRLERWMSRLLLPDTAAAQAPAPTPGSPAPAVVVPPTLPPGASPALTPITELTTLREEEITARTEIDKFSVEIHKKYTLSVACFNFVLIGIALALRFPRGGIGLVIGGSLVIFALFYVTLTAGESLADKDVIDPALAMWLPNGIVMVAGILGLLRVNREFGSTRGGDLADLTDLLFGRFRRRRG
ncbi:MAG: LptF/LptG family permease [Gemmatimonadales bacterium]